MKRLLILVAMAGLSVCAQAEGISCDAGRAKVQQVVEMQGKSASEIYASAQRWIALAFHNKDKVVQTQIENELIRGDGYEPERLKMVGVRYDLKYSFAVDVKDNKLRFTLYDMVLVGKNGGSDFPVESYLCKSDGTFRSIPFQTKSVKESIETFSAELIASLNTAVAEKRENW